MENNKILIRMLEKEEKPEALKLIWEVFSRFEAPDYSPGRNKFFQGNTR